jgi:hypothetical protein
MVSLILLPYLDSPQKQRNNSDHHQNATTNKTTAMTKNRLKQKQTILEDLHNEENSSDRQKQVFTTIRSWKICTKKSEAASNQK